MPCNSTYWTASGSTAARSYALRSTCSCAVWLGTVSVGVAPSLSTALPQIKRIHLVTVGQHPAQRLEHDDGRTFTPHVPVRSGVEREATSVWRQPAESLRTGRPLGRGC